MLQIAVFQLEVCNPPRDPPRPQPARPAGAHGANLADSAGGGAIAGLELTGAVSLFEPAGTAKIWKNPQKLENIVLLITM